VPFLGRKFGRIIGGFHLLTEPIPYGRTYEKGKEKDKTMHNIENKYVIFHNEEDYVSYYVKKDAYDYFVTVDGIEQATLLTLEEARTLINEARYPHNWAIGSLRPSFCVDKIVE
jgi:hypothetical protein